MKTTLPAALAAAAISTCAFAHSPSVDGAARPTPHAPTHSASVVRVAENHAGGHGAGHMARVEAEGGFARAMLPGAKTGGGYLTLRNGTTADDRLLAISSPRAGRVELHRTEMNGAVMTMRKLEDGLPMPAGESVALAPGGTHLMFLEVVEPFTEGDRIPLTLRFEKAGPVEAELLVGPPNATAPGAGGHAH